MKSMPLEKMSLFDTSAGFTIRAGMTGAGFGVSEIGFFS